MILRLKQFFESRLALDHSTNAVDLEHRLKLACCALLVEIIYADMNVTATENAALCKILREEFSVSQAELDDMLALAHQEKHDAVDYYRFTALINEHYTQAQKTHLIEQLWAIANADRHIDKFEEHLVRRLAELLHVPHRHFMQSKHRVLGK